MATGNSKRLIKKAAEEDTNRVRFSRRILSDEYYTIFVRPKKDFSVFCYRSCSKNGHNHELAGQNKDGVWNTQSWLISKYDAHIDNGNLVPDTDDARTIIALFTAGLTYVERNVFAPRSADR